MVVVGVFSLGAATTLVMYLVSAEMNGARRGSIHRFVKRPAFQSIKIVVVVWQILIQVGKRDVDSWFETKTRSNTHTYTNSYSVLILFYRDVLGHSAPFPVCFRSKHEIPGRLSALSGWSQHPQL